MELGEIKKVLQHNIEMKIIVTTSELIWKTVCAMEGGFGLPTCVSVTSGEVRKAEKEAMFYDRNASKWKADDEILEVGSQKSGKRDWAFKSFQNFSIGKCWLVVMRR